MAPTLSPLYLEPDSPPSLPAVADEVHVWRIDAGVWSEPAILAALEGVITDDERARIGRFVRARDRHLQLLARSVVRLLLAGYAGVPPGTLRFGAGPHGKPVVLEPRRPAVPGFNLSHTDGLVVAAIAAGPEVGVDAEAVDRRVAGLDLARRFFARAEVAALEAAPPAERVEMFFAFWTLKEAYLKARGLGLSIPLRSFAFELQPTGPDGARFAPDLEDIPDAWQFTRHRAGDRHRLAVAVRRPAGNARTIRLGEVRPTATTR